MPTIYKKKAGSRRYSDYTQEKLDQCLKDVRSKILSQRDAALKYNIPRSTIKNKLKNKHCNKPGHPTIFSIEEEQAFVAHFSALSEFGFPLTNIDITIIIKHYLSARGREVKQFKNNIPGTEWIRGFLRRNKPLSRRFANHIKNDRGEISENNIKNFIDHLETELEGIPPENIYNYDEINLTDDPGKRQVISRRDTKYPESIGNAAKGSFSVFFCGNAAGEIVQPYVIFKAEFLLPTCTESGPNRASYNRTKSGWIDSHTFEDWFISHVLPILSKKQGRKVIIGDNLSSHINENVLAVCKSNNISFVCFPPNTSHILQPLNVAYFGPLEIQWRRVLLDWKNSPEGRRLPTVPEDQFPRLLKTALDNMKETKTNLISGFRQTGIYPQSKEEPLSKLLTRDKIVNLNLISDTFLQNLKRLRNNDSPTQKHETKKNKLDVPLGQSICSEDISDIEQAGPSGMSQTKPRTNSRKNKEPLIRKSFSSECSDTEISLASSTEDLITARSDFEEDLPLSQLTNPYAMSDFLDYDEEPRDDLYLANYEDKYEKEPNVAKSIKSDDLNSMKSDAHSFNDEGKAGDNLLFLKRVHLHDHSYSVSADAVFEEERPCGSDIYCIGDYVFVNVNDIIRPGQITLMCIEGALINCMKKDKIWKWPAIKDEQLCSWELVLEKCNIQNL